DEFLLRLGGGWLFDELRNLVEPFPASYQAAAYGAIVGKFAFVGGLNGRNRAIFSGGDLDQLLSGALFATADIEMIADQKEERFAANKLTRAVNRISISAWLGLLDELQVRALASGGGGVGGLIARTDNHTNIFDPR